ncbi:MAG: LysM peptidoglycan-binding domain-containing protein [bacterium]
MKLKRWFSAFAALFLLASGGCVTMTQADYAQQQSEMDTLREDLQKVRERQQAVDMELQALHRDIETTRAGASDAGLRARLEEQDRRIQTLAAARSADRQEIVDDISRRVAAMMNGGGAARTPGKASSGRASQAPAKTETGYEHVVKSGETLSAIAKAYGTTSSAILKASNLKSDNIRVGQKLFVPAE